MLEHLWPTAQTPDRAVVIGANGFVGAAITQRLAADGIAHVAITRSHVDLLAPDATSRLASLLAPRDSVVFVSAMAPARTPAMLVQNIRMVETLTDGLAASPVAHVVYISSDAVYADDGHPVTEASCCHPGSLHGMMHAARELILQVTVTAPLAILRPTLIYGAADPHNSYGPNRFRRQAATGEPITLFGEGEERRDHVFIEDVGVLVVQTLRHRSRGILNIATGVSVSFREVAQRVAELAGGEVAIIGTPRRNPITHRYFDITSCLKAFPTFRYTTLTEGLQRCAK